MTRTHGIHAVSRRIVALAALIAAAACSGGGGERASGEGAAEEGAPRADSLASGSRPGGGEVTARGFAGTYDLGDYTVRGEVVNHASAPIYDVEVEITYRGASGEVLGTEAGAALISRVEPGGTAPVVDTRYGAPRGIASVTATVTGWKTKNALDPQPLTILGTAARTGVSGVIVTGQARNDAGRPLNSVKLVASFRNRAGEVTGVSVDYPLTAAMPAGQTLDFTIETIDATLSGDSALVQGEGH